MNENNPDLKSPRAAVNRSEEKRAAAGGVPVRSTTRWIHKRYAKDARRRINEAVTDIIDEIIAKHPDAKVSARDAPSESGQRKGNG